MDNLDGAIKFIIDSKETHPNRIDICTSSAGVAGGFSPNPINQGTGSSTFPPPNSLGSNPFGTTTQQKSGSAFGPSQSTAPGFGQASNLGQRPSAFGVPNQPFGGPIQQNRGAFGQPSDLGQRPNPFAPSNANSQINTFSSYANNGNAFNQQAQNPIQPTPFGGPASQNQSSQSGVFGQPSGQTPSSFPPSTLATPPNPFGTPSPAHANPFQTSKPPPAAAAVSPFAPSNPQPSVFNPFKAQSERPVNNAFQPNGSRSNDETAGAFTGRPPSGLQNIANGSHEAGAVNWKGAPTPSQNTSVDKDGRLSTFNGMKVIYQNGSPGVQNKGGVWERIWCPYGAPNVEAQTEMDESFYDEKVETAYKHLQQYGTFQDAIMPLVPPKREWCSFGF